MAKAKKVKKPRAKKYEPKVAINGTFEQVIGIALTKPKDNKEGDKTENK